MYKQVEIGNPVERGNLLGSLHTRSLRESFDKGIDIIKSQAGPNSSTNSESEVWGECLLLNQVGIML